MLQTAYHAVLSTAHKTDQDELAFVQQISEAVRVCLHVCTHVEMVNCYFRVLNESLLECFPEKISQPVMYTRAEINLM